jgi:hypothetical protein
MRLSRHRTYVNPLPVPVASLDILSFQLFLATSSGLRVYALPTHADGIPPSASDNKGLDVIKTIDLPSISGVPPQSNITFRAAR